MAAKATLAAAAFLLLWGVLRIYLGGFTWVDAASIFLTVAATVDVVLALQSRRPLGLRTAVAMWGAAVFVLISPNTQFEASLLWVVVCALYLLLAHGLTAGIASFGFGVSAALVVAFANTPSSFDAYPIGSKLLFVTAAVAAGAYMLAFVESSLLISRDTSAINLAKARSTSFAESNKNQHLLHMNHELRTPLTAIVGAVGLLASNKSNWHSDNSRTDVLIQTIAATANHALAIVNDVLDVERLESGVAVSQKAPFSIRNVIRQSIAISEAHAATVKSRLRMRVGSELPDEWIGPETRIRQVLLNLIANAIKYAPGSDVIIAASSSLGNLVLEIRDHGPGMPLNVQSKLFQSFSSSEGAPGSTGLGLRICKLIVEVEMGGKIQVVTTPGHGTDFTITLPLEKVTKAQVADLAQEGVTEAQGPIKSATSETTDISSYKRRFYGKRILLVEDDVASIQIMAMVLEDAGFHVVSATSSQEALELFGKFAPFDIAMLDHNLGTLSQDNGIHLTKLLKDRGIPIVIGHSGNYSKEIESEWVKAGLREVIRKPISLDDVLRILATALNV